MATSSNLLQQFAKKSLQYKLAILFLALILVVGVYYQFVYSELSAKEESLSQRKSSLLAQQRTLDKNLIEQEKLKVKYEELQRSIRDNQKALPTQAELPAFFDHLQRKAGDSGVSIHKWDRMDEQPVDIYIRVPVAIEISGTFYEITHYFSLLGPQRKDELQDAGSGDSAEGPRIDERIVSIENLELGKAKLQDGEITLEAKFVASTFRQNEPKSAPGKKPGKAGSGAAKSKSKSKGKAGARRMTGAGVKASIGAASGAAAAKSQKSQNQAAPPGRQPTPTTDGTSSGGGNFGGRNRRRKRTRRPVRLGASEQSASEYTQGGGHRPRHDRSAA